MQIPAPLVSLFLVFALLQQSSQPNPSGKLGNAQLQATARRQLYAVGGKIIAKKSAEKGGLKLTVKQRVMGEVFTTARKNVLVGNAVPRPGNKDLVGFLWERNRAAKPTTAAELVE